MSPIAQRIAIAESHDPHTFPPGKGREIREEPIWLMNNRAFGKSPVTCADYLDSRDAMAQALESLSTDKRFDCWLHLWRIVHGDQFDYASASPNACVKCLLATPEQQAEAYLRALNLWVDHE